jgi:DNA-binding FadR family transcriptional regulator
VSKSKHDEIADALTREVLVGQYRVGERLPSERDLAARFEANRGAVREAMKKLEQLGIAQIQPGGARVAPLQEASLDVIGHLLALGDVPDRQLVEQIMDVISNLIQTAAVSAVERADDDELMALRALAAGMHSGNADPEAQLEARISLMSGLMRASGKLVVQLIARSLLVQFLPRMNELRGYGEEQTAPIRAMALELDAAMGSRDLDAVREILKRMSEANRAQMRRTFEAYEAAQQQGLKEVAAS